MRPTNGYPYRYELHCHTCRCSKCAHSTPVEMARAYYEKGYAGMVSPTTSSGATRLWIPPCPGRRR